MFSSSTQRPAAQIPEVFKDPRLALLDRAIEAVGSAEAVAELLGVTRRTVVRWKSSPNQMAADRQQTLAAVAGERSVEEAGEGPSARNLRRVLAERTLADAAVREVAVHIDGVFSIARSDRTVIERFPGLDPAAIRRYLAERFAGAARRGSRSAKVWSTGEILAAIAAASDDEGVVTGARYDAYRARVIAEGGEAPARPTILNRFGGSWVAAVEAAGRIPGRARRTLYARQWDDPVIRQIVRTFVAEQAPGARDLRWACFAEWLEQSGSVLLPSASTVRQRVGDWPVYVDEVAAEVDRAAAA